MKKNSYKRFQNLLIALIIGISLLSGCTILSFYPFYTLDVLQQDNRLEGKWMVIEINDGSPGKADTTIWEIHDYIPKDENKTKPPVVKSLNEIKVKFLYLLKVYNISQPEKTAEFNLYLMNVQGQNYLDFFPENWEIDDDLLDFHMLPAHSLAKVNLSDSLIINWINIEWFEEMINENKIRIHYEDNKNYKLLTAKPEELQKFIQKYGKDKAAWEDGLNYKLGKYPS